MNAQIILVCVLPFVVDSSITGLYSGVECVFGLITIVMQVMD